MKTRSATFSPRRLVRLTLTVIVFVCATRTRAANYDWISSTAANWTTTTAWSPNGAPGSLDDINMSSNTTIGSMALNGTTQTINSLSKTGTATWVILGNAAASSILNVGSISTGTGNLQFRDGTSTGGLQVNAGNITITSGGQIYFGTTSGSAANLMRGVTVSGTTTVSGTGFLRMNVVNTSGNSFSLGLVNVSGTGEITLANAPSGKAATTGTVTGLNGSGGVIQANLAITETGNVATLAIVNTNDYSSATVLRDGVATTHGGTLLVTKAGAGTQTLTGVNTYTGATTITNGVLKMGNASALGGRAGIVPTNTDNGTNVSATGTLDLGGQTGVTEVIRLNGAGFGGNGALVNSGAAASISNGVASIKATTGGTTAPTLTLSGGGGSGATATATMGATTASFTINGGTTTYSTAPTVTITGGGASVQALATAILTGGVVTGISVTNAGAGYTSAPTITFSGGTVTTAGTNPTGTGNATNFTPVAYNITAAGSGYTSAPTVSFSSGTFAATTALSGIVLVGNSSIGGSGDITVNGVVSESGGSRVLTKVGTNTLTLANNGNSYTGGTIINGGAVAISADAALGTAPGAATAAHLTLNNGALATTGTFALNSNRGITLGASGGTVDVATGTTLSYGGIVADGGSLTKTGIGTLALSGASTYTGATAINAGTVAISNHSALGTSAAGTTVANNATLALSGDITVTGETLSLTGDGASASAGALRNMSGNNTWTGNLTVTAGATRISSDAGSLLISGDIATNGSGNFNIGGNGDLEFSGVISGPLALFKSAVGTGTVTLSNAGNTYTGITTVGGGTLKISSDGNLGAVPGSFTATNVRIRGGASTLQTTATMALNANRGIQLGTGGGSIKTDATTALTVNGVISGGVSDALTKSGEGRLIVTASNTYSGVTDVTAGSLQVGLNGAGRSGTGAVTVRTDGTVLGSGIVQGSSFTAESGAVVQAGDGTAESDYGSLTFTPASGSGVFDFQSGSSVILGINPGGTGDLLSFDGLSAGTLNFNGDLNVMAGGYIPASADIFDLIDWANLTTVTFASRYSASSYGGYLLGNGDDNLGFDLPDISGSGYGWDISNFTTNGTISTVLLIVPEPTRMVLLLGGLLVIRLRRRRLLPR